VHETLLVVYLAPHTDDLGAGYGDLYPYCHVDTDGNVDEYGDVDTYAHLDGNTNMDSNVHTHCTNGGRDATTHHSNASTDCHYATARDLNRATSASGGNPSTYCYFCATSDAHDSLLRLAAVSKHLFHSGHW
jgi:hypothetical protein